MAQAVDSIASAVEQLSERVRELEQRIAVLEDQAPGSSYPRLTGTEIQEPRVPVSERGSRVIDVSSGAVPILGKAVLGIAGAYLLRAIAELGTIPKLPVLILAIVYATGWMVWATKTYAANRFASATYGVTSVLILSPLLWESTVRFHVLTPAFASVVLVAFTVLALALAWRGDLQVIPWVVTLATVTTALALIIETRELVPLTAALLAVALATEAEACLGHRLSLRAVPALAADFAVWLLVYVMTSLGGVPEGYHPTSPATLVMLCVALLVIYGGSIGVRSFCLRQRMTFFEVGQAVIAFVLAAYGTMRATQNEAALELGVVFLGLAAVCYWGTLSRFADEMHVRNRRVSANWAAALLLAGNFLLIPALLCVPFLCFAAAAAAFLYTRTAKTSLGLHASFYLAAATAVSPLPAYASSALAGMVPGFPDGGVWIVAVSGVLCYTVGSRRIEDQGKRRLLWVLPAALAGCAAAAMAVAAVVGLSAGHVGLSPSRLSVIRTIVNCALAFAFGFLGSRWMRIELGWVAYAAVAFGTLKLLFEDLRFGNAASLVVSLLFYGLILILLPRLTRRNQAGP